MSRSYLIDISNVTRMRDGDARARGMVCERDRRTRTSERRGDWHGRGGRLLLTLALLERPQIILAHNLAWHLTAIEGTIAHRASRSSMERWDPAYRSRESNFRDATRCHDDPRVQHDGRLAGARRELSRRRAAIGVLRGRPIWIEAPSRIKKRRVRWTTRQAEAFGYYFIPMYRDRSSRSRDAFLLDDARIERHLRGMKFCVDDIPL